MHRLYAEDYLYHKLVGIAAMIATRRLVSARPTAGINLEPDIIAAVAIGGAGLSDGHGTVVGTIIGALLIPPVTSGSVSGRCFDS